MNLAIATPNPALEQEESIRTAYADGLNKLKAKIDHALKLAKEGTSKDWRHSVGQMSSKDMEPITSAMNEMKELEKKQLRQEIQLLQADLSNKESALTLID